MGSVVKKVTSIPKKIIKTVKKNPELLALAAFNPGALSALQSGITAAGSSAFLKGAAKRALIQALATKATGGDVSIKDSLIGGAVGQGIGQFANNAAMFKGVNEKLLQGGIGAATNVGTSLARGQKIDPKSALISGGLNYLMTPQGLSTDDAIGYDEQLRIEQGAPDIDIAQEYGSQGLLGPTQATNIMPQPKPEFLGQELRQTPTVATAYGPGYRPDTQTGTNLFDTSAQAAEVPMTSDFSFEEAAKLDDALRLEQAIAPAASYPTSNDYDAAITNIDGKAYGTAEMPSTLGQTPKVVLSDIANKLNPLGDDFNIVDAAKLTAKYAQDKPYRTIAAITAAAPLFFSPVPQEGETEEDFTQRKVDVTNYLRQYGSNFYSGADLDDFISRTTSNLGYAQGGRVGLEMGGDVMDSYVPTEEEIELMRRINEFNKQRAMLEDLEDARENAREDKMGGGIMGLGKIPMGTPRMNEGGATELDYRAEGGFVPVGIKEKADDVPAMLSKNEFVMTADAVRAAGNGSIEKGAQKMYDTMKQLESRVV